MLSCQIFDYFAYLTTLTYVTFEHSPCFCKVTRSELCKCFCKSTQKISVFINNFLPTSSAPMHAFVVTLLIMALSNQMPSPSGSPSPDYLLSQNSELLSQANQSLIPQISEKKYKEWFEKYDEFVISRKLNYTEDSLLMYLEYFSQSELPAWKSMYSYASGIKSVLLNCKGINTNKWYRVKGWLKQFSSGKTVNKAPTYTTQEMCLFRKNAPTIKFRRHKIAERFGTYGRLRGQDYANLHHNKSSKVGQEEKIDIYDSYVYMLLYLFFYILYISYINRWR